MTKHMTDRPYVYGGICLDDGFQVNTEKHERYTALCDIIGKIVDSETLIEKMYAERYPDKPVQPFKNIMKENPKLYKKFMRRMKNALSLDEYDNLWKRLCCLGEWPKFDPEEPSEVPLKSTVLLQIHKALAFCTFVSILPYCVPILYDCKEMGLALNTVQKDPRLRVAKIKYRRV
jgi:hypothetical protein